MLSQQHHQWLSGWVHNSMDIWPDVRKGAGKDARHDAFGPLAGMPDIHASSGKRQVRGIRLE